MKKRVLTMLLAVAVMLTFGMPSIVATADVYPELLLDTPVTVTLEAEEKPLYSFVPEHDGRYMLESYLRTPDTADPIVILYDGEMNELAREDDYNGMDFLLEYPMTAGTQYYFTPFDYNGQPATFTVCLAEIEPTEIYLENPEERMGVAGFTYAFQYTIFPEGARDTITWESSNKSVLTVDENGVVSFLKAGEATVTATLGNGLWVSRDFVVFDFYGTMVADTAYPITFTEENMGVQMYSFTPTVSGFYGICSYDCENEIDPIVTLYDGNGAELGRSDDYSDRNFYLEKELDAGETYYLGLEQYYEHTETYYAKIVSLVEPESVTITADRESCMEGESITLTLSYAPENATHPTVEWTSSDESVATVDSDGEVQFHAGGEVEITATLPNGVSDTITLSASAVPTLALDTPYTVSNVENEGFSFIPSQTGLYTFHTTSIAGNGNAMLELYTDKHVHLVSHNVLDYQKRDGFSLPVVLEAGKKYYLSVSTCTDVTVTFEVTQADGATLPVIPPNTDLNQVIGIPGSVVYYRFHVLTAGEYTFYTTSEIDTYGALYDSAWNIIDYNDDSSDDSDFIITEQLNAGETVYIMARPYSTGYEGSYVLRMDAPYTVGDVNTDGAVNMMDALLAYSTAAGGSSALDGGAMDMNGDGKLNMFDALLLYKIAGGQA